MAGEAWERGGDREGPGCGAAQRGRWRPLRSGCEGWVGRTGPGGQGVLSVACVARSSLSADWMPAGGGALSHAARALGRATALLCPRPQLPLATAFSCSAGGSPGCWWQLLFQPVPVPSPKQRGVAGASPLSFPLSPLRSACAAAETMAEQRYCVDYAKRGTAGCKKCKEKIVKGMVRIGKIVPNPFTESGGDMKEWYHVKCIFEKLDKARATTKKIEDITDLEGWEELQDEEKDTINKYIAGEAQGSARVTLLLIFKLYLLSPSCAFAMKSSWIYLCGLGTKCVVLLLSLPQPCRKGKKWSLLQ